MISEYKNVMKSSTSLNEPVQRKFVQSKHATHILPSFFHESDDDTKDMYQAQFNQVYIRVTYYFKFIIKMTKLIYGLDKRK